MEAKGVRASTIKNSILRATTFNVQSTGKCCSLKKTVIAHVLTSNSNAIFSLKPDFHKHRTRNVTKQYKNSEIQRGKNLTSLELYEGHKPKEPFA